MADRPRPRRGGGPGPGPRSARAPRKDRLIQTRVPRALEETLKEEAQRRRLTVSHLIRDVLEDAFHLVDGVVADVDQLVSDSVRLARGVGRRLGSVPDDEPEPGGGDGSDDPRGDDDGLDHVYAWNEVVLHRPVVCSRCGAAIGRGETGYAGLSDRPVRDRAWLCASCIEDL